MLDNKRQSKLELTDAEIERRLKPIRSAVTLDTGSLNRILDVQATYVLVESEAPLEAGEPKERKVTFEMIRDWEAKPHRSIRRTLARILGLNVPNS